MSNLCRPGMIDREDDEDKMIEAQIDFDLNHTGF